MLLSQLDIFAFGKIDIWLRHSIGYKSLLRRSAYRSAQRNIEGAAHIENPARDLYRLMHGTLNCHQGFQGIMEEMGFGGVFCPVIDFLAVPAAGDEAGVF